MCIYALYFRLCVGGKDVQVELSQSKASVTRHALERRVDGSRAVEIPSSDVEIGSSFSLHRMMLPQGIVS